MEKKIYKIAIVSPSLPPLSMGGVSSAHYNLGLTLKHYGFAVEWFTYLDRQTTDESPDVHRFGIKSFFAKIIRKISNLYFRFKSPGKLCYQTHDILLCQWGAWRMRSALKKFDPDIVFLPDHGCPALSLGSLPNAKIIWVSHHNPGRFDSPLLFHTPTSSVDIDLALFLEKRGLRKCNCIICPTLYMKRCAEKFYQPDCPIYILPNLLANQDLQNVRPKSVAKELGKLDADVQVIYIPSAGQNNKGERYLFEIIRHIAKRNKDVLFFLSGELSIVLKQELSVIPWLSGRIFAPGQLPYLENLAFVAGSSICVSPTLAENFSMALIEAQYFGLPTVTFDIGGNSEVVKDTYTGSIVPFLDVEALIEKTLYLLNPQMREMFSSMSQNAREHAVQLAGVNVVKRYIKLINELLETS